MAANLNRVYRRFVKESSLLEVLIASTASKVPVNDVQGQRTKLINQMCVIRLHDAWHRFCRELILSSAGGKTVTSSGVRLALSPKVNNSSEVLPFLQRHYRRPIWWEPTWHDPTKCLDAAFKLDVSNYANVFAGLSLSFNGSNPAAQLTIVRNYFAHRNQSTYHTIITTARSLSLVPVPPPYEIVTSIVPPGVPLFSQWTARLSIMAQLAIK